MPTSYTPTFYTETPLAAGYTLADSSLSSVMKDSGYTPTITAPAKADLSFVDPSGGKDTSFGFWDAAGQFLSKGVETAAEIALIRETAKAKSIGTVFPTNGVDPSTAKAAQDAAAATAARNNLIMAAIPYVIGAVVLIGGGIMLMRRRG